MKIELGVAQQTRQTLVMTQQAIQAIEILGYGQEELEAFLQEQLERNPLLQQATAEPSPATPHPLSVPLPTHLFAHHPASHGGSADLQSLAETVSVRTTLRDHLHQQLSLFRISEDLRVLACYLIDSLEPDGYLRCAPDELAALLDLPCGSFDPALQLVQSLDPAGVGARSLPECLALQLRDQGRLSPTLQALLADLDLLESGDAERLARRCKVSMEQLGGLIGLLRTLDPRPGYRFNFEPVQPALPDILVTISPEGRVRVEYNPALLPRLMVDKVYFAELDACLQTRSDKEFLYGCLRQANTLIHHLDQRIQTTLHIATEIIHNQAAFLLHGDGHLRPLLQKDIARVLGLHESTVSRSIANKYMQCPQGLVPFRHFFSDGLQAANGDPDIAAAAIRHRIRDLVSGETLESVLSDEAIVDLLQGEGIQIARRTVAKYRTQLKIPSSAQRRRRMRLPWHVTSQNPAAAGTMHTRPGP
ncbi:RNA polymerase factor sigma-54 [Castellaniella sp.]|uniref:RNA polymerase factor sigma-54 n=1 Tax=Castellaniella sp. TaxID=1955812 RepID=UPI003562FEA2